MSIKEGLPDRGEDVFFVALFVLFPILNIYAIHSTVGEDWISLWFRRKALEEKKKIERLNDQK